MIHITGLPSPADVVGLTLLDGMIRCIGGDVPCTVIYQRTADGDLWFCRDVEVGWRNYEKTIAAWVNTTPGELRDLRASAGKET